MRSVNLFLLTPDKKTIWMTIPWGKKYLDDIRSQGYIILMSV